MAARSSEDWPDWKTCRCRGAAYEMGRTEFRRSRVIRTLAGCVQGKYRDMKDESQEPGLCEGMKAKGGCREDDVIKQ